MALAPWRQHPALLALICLAVDEKPWSHRYSEENMQYREENDYW